MGQILTFINHNIPVDNAGRKTGYTVTGVNINDRKGIINLSWDKCKYFDDGNGNLIEDTILETRTEQVTDSLLMKKFDNNGNILTEEQPVYSQVQNGEDDFGNPTYDTIQTGTQIAPQQIGAYTQWLSILKQDIKNVPITALISGFIMGMESQS